jgi:hypothetical protein
MASQDQLENKAQLEIKEKQEKPVFLDTVFFR